MPEVFTPWRYFSLLYSLTYAGSDHFCSCLLLLLTRPGGNMKDLHAHHVHQDLTITRRAVVADICEAAH
jgi:hypothetical protein